MVINFHWLFCKALEYEGMVIAKRNQLVILVSYADNVIFVYKTEVFFFVMQDLLVGNRSVSRKIFVCFVYNLNIGSTKGRISSLELNFIVFS